MSTIPVWLKDLIDKHNASGDDAGIAGVLNFYPFVMRVGRLLLEEPNGSFMTNLTDLVESHETAARERHECLESLKYPSLTSKIWGAELHVWMQEIYDALHELEGSPMVEVPEPPSFNRAQRRLMKKFNLGLFFVPAWDEKDYPKSWVKLDWPWSAQDAGIPLPGRWIAFEMIQKPNFGGVRPDDRLMEQIGLKTRFYHTLSGKAGGDGLVEDIFPKAAQVLNPLGGTVQIQSVEVFNFLGNVFNWATTHTADSFPDLGSTKAVELCANHNGPWLEYIVGNSDYGGLACVQNLWCIEGIVWVAFRFLVQF